MKCPERSNFFAALGAGFAVAIFCLLLLWHDPLFFWKDDYEISILPVFADVARSWSHGEWPLLSPYSWVCGNLAGEYQYGTFSVFINAAVVLIWKFPLTFPQQAAALSIVHLFVLGMGGYLLARGRNLAPPLSLMVALVAALNGWIICWGATDWFGALGAFAWLPWAWWAMERALDPQRGRFRFLWPAPFVYLVLTGGFPYTVLMLGLVGAWCGIKSLGQTRRISSVLPLVFGTLLGIGLAAPAWLALLDYVRGSARAVQDPAQHFQWRVPISALPGFFLPGWTVNWSDFSSRLRPHRAIELASGFVSPFAVLAGFVLAGRALVRAAKWELALLIVALTLCLLPTANVFRWSFRWLPLVHLVMALCAAEALRLFFGRALPPAPGALSRRVRDWLPALITFSTLVITYLWTPTNGGVPKYNLAQELTLPAPLDRQHLYLSIYPPPEVAYRAETRPEPFGPTVRPGSTSMWGGVRFINGYSPIRPSGVAREFDSAIHGEIPPEKAAALLQRDGGPEGLLARLGIDGIIVADGIDVVPQPESEWHLAAATSEGRIFHRWQSLPALRSLPSIDSRPNEQFTHADISGIEPGRNRLEANVVVPGGARPALLAISRPFFDGYRARIGERVVTLQSYRGLMPVVEIPPGTSGRLIVVYRPWWLIAGGWIAILSVLLWLSGTAVALVTGLGARKVEASS